MEEKDHEEREGRRKGGVRRVIIRRKEEEEVKGDVKEKGKRGSGDSAKKR